ncbi:Protein PTHB1 [Chytriomyces hyalinus]|nr:Protein PTHB1 [Chytriomyces hyalinus]
MAWGRKPSTAEPSNAKAADSADARATTAPELKPDPTTQTPVQAPPPPPPPPPAPPLPEHTRAAMHPRDDPRRRAPDRERVPKKSEAPPREKIRFKEFDDDDGGLHFDEDEMGVAGSPTTAPPAATTTHREHHRHSAAEDDGPSLKELANQLEIERFEKEELMEDNEDLRAKVAALKRKLLAAIAIKEKESKHANIVPVSIEANMNLRYQFQKRLLAAKEEYASLMDENRKLAGRIKELESSHAKRDVHVSKARLNEVLMWKKKYKDLESEKHKLEENFAVFVKKLEKVEAERDKIAATFGEAQIQFSQRMTYDDYSLGSLDDLAGSPSRKSITRRSSNFKPSVKHRRSTNIDDFDYDDVVRLQSPSAFTPKLKNNIPDDPYDNNQAGARAGQGNASAIQDANLPSIDNGPDKFRSAKTQLEYNAYVKGKPGARVTDWWQHKFDARQSLNCVDVGKLGNSSDSSEFVVTGCSDGILRVFHPQSQDYIRSHLIYEKNLGYPIIQVSIGFFLPSVLGNCIAVLGSQTLSMLAIQRQEDNDTMFSVVAECKLESEAYSFCKGPFGRCSTHELICVQSIDGILSIIDCGQIICSKQLPLCLLPGPIKYIPSTDALVTYSSDYCLEAYQISSLIPSRGSMTAEDRPSVVQKDRNQKAEASWSCLLGEIAIDIIVGKLTTTTNEFHCDVSLIGMMTLFVYSDKGVPKFQIALDYIPRICISFNSDGNNNSISSIIIVSTTGSLRVYRDFKVRWIARLPEIPFAIKTGAFNGIPGFIVTISSDFLTIRAPNIIPNTQMFVHPEARALSEIEKELQETQRAIRLQGTAAATGDMAELRMTASFDENSESRTLFRDVIIQTAECAFMTLCFTNQSQKNLLNVSVSIIVPTGFVLSQSHFSIPVFNDVAELVTSIAHVGLSVMSLVARVLVVYETVGGTGFQSTVFNAKIPTLLCGIFERCAPEGSKKIKKLDLVSNKASVQVEDLFSDALNKKADLKQKSLLFRFKKTRDAVEMISSKSSGRYRLQAEDLGSLLIPLTDLRQRLDSHFSLLNDPGHSLHLKDAFDFPALVGLMSGSNEKRLERNRHRFTLLKRNKLFNGVQNALLARYAQTSEACPSIKALEILLKMAFEQVQEALSELNKAEEELRRSTAMVAGSIRILSMYHPQSSARVVNSLCSDSLVGMGV